MKHISKCLVFFDFAKTKPIGIIFIRIVNCVIGQYRCIIVLKIYKSLSKSGTILDFRFTYIANDIIFTVIDIFDLIDHFYDQQNANNK